MPVATGLDPSDIRQLGDGTMQDPNLNPASTTTPYGGPGGASLFPGAAPADLPVLGNFQAFGYNPSQAELTAFSSLWEEGAAPAVADYVLAMQQLTGAQGVIQGQMLSEEQASNMSRSLGNILEESGQEAYNQAAAIFTQAPQLFGSLTPDQISQYLAPTQQAFNQAEGQTEGGMAARGLGGSSIEGQAIGQQLSLFRQNVLSQGLQIGMTQQQMEAAALEAKGGQQFAAGQQQYSLGAQYQGLAQGSANANTQIAGDIASLPSQIANQQYGRAAAAKALNPPPISGLSSELGTGLGVVGGVIGGIYGGPMGAAAGYGIGSGVGGAIGTAVGGPNQQPSYTSSGTNLSNGLMLGSYLYNQRNNNAPTPPNPTSGLQGPAFPQGSQDPSAYGDIPNPYPLMTANPYSGGPLGLGD